MLSDIWEAEDFFKNSVYEHNNHWNVQWRHWKKIENE